MIEYPLSVGDAIAEIDALPTDFTPTNDLATAVLEAAQAWDGIGGYHGLVYLLHFERPYRHAKHYTGWTPNLERRLDAHAKGRGARLMTVITEAGIGWTLARIWPGTRSLERSLKRQGGASRRCPLCQGGTP